MSIKFLVLGGGGILGLGGGKCRFYFYGHGDFSELLGCTPRGSCNRTLLRRVLRRHLVKDFSMDRGS